MRNGKSSAVTLSSTDDAGDTVNAGLPPRAPYEKWSLLGCYDALAVGASTGTTAI